MLQIGDACRVGELLAVEGGNGQNREAAGRTNGRGFDTFGMQNGKTIGEHAAGRKTLNEDLLVGLDICFGKLRARRIDHCDQLQVNPFEVGAFGSECVTI